MGLLKRNKPSNPVRREAEPASGPDNSDLADRCLDTFAAVIRAWRDHPFEIPETSPAEVREECEAWARHLLLATAPPGEEQPLPGGAREWVGLERYFRTLRQKEHASVTSSLSELHQVVWDCIQALGRVTTADTQSDSKISTRIQSLRSAAQGQDLGQLRQQVTGMLSLLESEIEARRARGQDEVERLSDRLQRVTAALMNERQNGKLDPLTQVYGRAALDTHMENLCEMAQVIQPTAVAFLIDVDHFKWVNDKFGHSTGDEALKRLAARLREQFKRRGDFVGRFGGDEFVAIVEESRPEAIQTIGERALFAVREIEVGGGDDTVRISVSIGAAALKAGETPREWLDRADKALYASKDQGKDRLTIEGLRC